MTTDFAAIVEAAQDKRTFDVLGFAKGRKYPQDIVTVYTDAESGYRAKHLSEILNDENDNEKREEIAEEIRAAWAAVEASALTFHLRGISQGAVEAIITEAGGKFDNTVEGPGAQWCNFRYIGENIVSVTNAEGAVDNHHWSFEDVSELHAYLPSDEFKKIAALTDELTFAAAFVDASVTPDFS